MVPLRPNQLRPLSEAFGEVACVPLVPIVPITSINRHQETGRLVASTNPDEPAMGPLGILKAMAEIGDFKVETGDRNLDSEINKDNYSIAAYLGGISLLNLSKLEALGEQVEQLSLEKVQLWTTVIAEATTSALIRACETPMDKDFPAKVLALTKIIRTVKGDPKLYRGKSSLGHIL